MDTIEEKACDIQGGMAGRLHSFSSWPDFFYTLKCEEPANVYRKLVEKRNLAAFRLADLMPGDLAEGM